MIKTLEIRTLEDIIEYVKNSKSVCVVDVSEECGNEGFWNSVSLMEVIDGLSNKEYLIIRHNPIASPEVVLRNTPATSIPHNHEPFLLVGGTNLEVVRLMEPFKSYSPKQIADNEMRETFMVKILEIKNKSIFTKRYPLKE